MDYNLIAGTAFAAAGLFCLTQNGQIPNAVLLILVVLMPIVHLTFGGSIFDIAYQFGAFLFALVSGMLILFRNGLPAGLVKVISVCFLWFSITETFFALALSVVIIGLLALPSITAKNANSTILINYSAILMIGVGIYANNERLISLIM